MDQLSGLRPPSRDLEAAGNSRDRAASEPPGPGGRFDEHLSKVDERRGDPARSHREGEDRTRETPRRETASRSEQDAARRRAQPAPEDREQAAEEAHDGLEQRVVAKPDVSELPTARRPVATPEGPAQPEPAEAAEGLSEIAPEAFLSAEVVSPANEQPGTAGAPAAAQVAGSGSPEALAAALFTIAQAAAQPATTTLPGTKLPSGEILALAESPSVQAPLPTGPSGAESQAEAVLGAATPAVRPTNDFEAERIKLRGAAPEAHAAPPAADQAADILRQVRVGLSADLREANIQLAPENLGRVSIRLRVEAGVMTADVRAETPEALRALERHAPELKAALAAKGVEPGAIDFQLGLFQPRGGDHAGRGHAHRSRSPRASSPSFELAPVEVERALARRLSAQGVDTYA